MLLENHLDTTIFCQDVEPLYHVHSYPLKQGQFSPLYQGHKGSVSPSEADVKKLDKKLLSHRPHHSVSSRTKRKCYL
eukprot:UN25351